MENLDSMILDLALITLVASVVVLIFRKINMPAVLGYILAGFLLGPYFPFFPVVGNIDNIQVWADLGIIFLMFSLGLEFSFRKIAKIGPGAAITAMTVMGGMIMVGFGIGSLMHWSRMDCLFLGGMISMSSTMIILKAYEEYGKKNERYASLVLGTMVVEDIGGIFMMVILSTVAVSQDVSGGQLLGRIGILLIYLVVWLVAGIFVIPTVLDKIKKLLNQETATIISIAICLVMVVIANMIGFSSALGAFLAGSILAGTVSAERIQKLITPIKDLFGAIFFVSVGMLVQPTMLIRYWKLILILVVVVIFGQMILSALGLILSGENLHTAVHGGMSMCQIGEFSFVLASMGISLGVIRDALYPVIVCVAIVTIFTTPFFIRSSDKVYAVMEKRMPFRMRKFFQRNTSSDKKTEKNRDSDWQLYTKRYLVRTVMATVALFAVYFLGRQYQEQLNRILPFVHSDYIIGVAVCVVMVLIILPMMVMRSHLYTKLWLKDDSNHVPLLTLKVLRIIIALSFIMAALQHFLGWSFAFLAIPIVLCIFLIARSDYFRSKTLRFEARFAANMNERTLHVLQKERGWAEGRHIWMADKLFVCEIQVVNYDHDITINDLFDNRYFHVVVMKIISRSGNTKMPKSKDVIHCGDVLQLVSSLTQLEAFLLMMQNDGHIEKLPDQLMTMNDFMKQESIRRVPPDEQIVSVAVPVRKDYFFCGKTIKNSGFRDRYLGFIVGIQRGNLPIVDPDVNTYLRPGDILWVLGTDEMAQKVLADGLMDEE